VCLVCEFNGTRWRDALLSGDLPLVMQAYSGGLTNVNLFSPLVAQEPLHVLRLPCAMGRAGDSAQRHS